MDCAKLQSSYVGVPVTSELTEGVRNLQLLQCAELKSPGSLQRSGRDVNLIK